MKIKNRTMHRGGKSVQRAHSVVQPVQRDMTVGNLTSPYGATSLFDICSQQDVISLSFQGRDQFIDWLPFRLTEEWTVKREFIAWERPAYADGAATAGWLSDPCADPNGVDWGKCDFTVTGFSRLRRKSPTRDVTENTTRLCYTQPRYRIDGTQITSVDEYDARLAMEVQLGDFRRMLINGNKQTSGQFDGLQRLIKTGYTNSDGEPCELMDSIVFDWGGNDLEGGANISVNGFAVPNTVSLVDALLWTYQRMKDRQKMSPALASASLDSALLMPGWLTRCLLDAFTCWSVCPGKEFNPTNLGTYEARQFRISLNGGRFGFGQITLDGDTIPLIGYDYGTMRGGVVNVTGITRSSTTATATTAFPHGLATGATVTIQGATNTNYNGEFTVTVTGATTFTYTVTNEGTSPDGSNSIIAILPQAGDIYFLNARAGSLNLIEIEALNMNSAPDLTGKFDILDGGRFLTWVNDQQTCYERVLEMRPRLVTWAPWMQARIENVTCETLAPAISMDPTSLAFPTRTFNSAVAA